MQKQLFQYIEKILSPFLYGCRKNFSTQTVLLGLVEKWKASLAKKVFDTKNHELLLAKLNAYGFDKKCIRNDEELSW